MKTLKSKAKALFSDEASRYRFSHNVQTVLVATFWLGLFALLAVYSEKHPLPNEVRDSSKIHDGTAGGGFK